METTYLNLVTGEHGELPEGAAFDHAERSGNGWIVTFRAHWEEDTPMYQLFRHLFYDADGNEYEINQWSSMFGDANEEGDITYFYDEFPLKNYPYDEVWLSPHFSHYWTAEDQIVITANNRFCGWHLWMPATFSYNLSVFANTLQEKVRKKAGKTTE